MSFNKHDAIQFVRSVKLKAVRRDILPQDASADATAVFDQAKAQSQVVGSGLFSFATGIDADVRQAISDSALLAQLVANQNADPAADPFKWFNEYSKVLENIGWIIQDGGWNDYTAEGTAAEVHKKILELLPVLAAAPAAVTIITAALTALQGMDSDSPWITLFRRESQHAQIARFQIGLVDKEADSDVFVSLFAFVIKADADETQVLFFKWKTSGAKFKANSEKVSINRQAIADLKDEIRKQVLAYRSNYVSSVLTVKQPAP